MFQWDATKEQAALLIAEGDLTVDEIAAKVEVTDRTIRNWKAEEEFQARIAEHVEFIRKQILSTSIADRVQRIRRYDRRWKQLDRIVSQRANDPAMLTVPGGDTGLLCRDIKSVGGGENAQLVDVYKVDTALIKEERELAKQAAQELGQWVEKQQHDFGTLSDDELIARAKALLAGATEEGNQPRQQS